MNQISDEGIVKLLSSRASEEADKAALEIFKRGVRILPLLPRYRGDKNFFTGSALYNPKANTIYPTPGSQPLPPGEDERVTTLEVAALYLISAIYYGDIHFAAAVLLTNKNLPPHQREAKNSKENLERAWSSAVKWIAECKQKGLDKLREEMRGPLTESQLDWY